MLRLMFGRVVCPGRAGFTEINHQVAPMNVRLHLWGTEVTHLGLRIKQGKSLSLNDLMVEFPLKTFFLPPPQKKLFVNLSQG